MRRALTMGAWLIGTYLVLSKATGAGTVLSKGGDTTVKFVRALQGR